MATQPPPETPPPTQPVQPEPGPSEFPAPTPDFDQPSPGTTPDDPGTASPMGFGSPSRVGDREPGDTDDIGSTDRMASETGGLAGTSR